MIKIYARAKASTAAAQTDFGYVPVRTISFGIDITF